MEFSVTRAPALSDSDDVAAAVGWGFFSVRIEWSFIGRVCPEHSMRKSV